MPLCISHSISSWSSRGQIPFSRFRSIHFLLSPPLPLPLPPLALPPPLPPPSLSFPRSSPLPLRLPFSRPLIGVVSVVVSVVGVGVGGATESLATAASASGFHPGVTAPTSGVGRTSVGKVDVQAGTQEGARPTPSTPPSTLPTSHPISGEITGKKGSACGNGIAVTSRSGGLEGR